MGLYTVHFYVECDLFIDSTTFDIFTVKTIRENFQLSFSDLYSWIENIVAAVDDDGGVTSRKYENL